MGNTFVTPLHLGIAYAVILALFVASGGVYTALSIFAFYRMFARAAKAKEEQKPIIPLPGGQFTAGTLYNTMRDQMDRDLARLSGGGRRR